MIPVGNISARSPITVPQRFFGMNLQSTSSDVISPGMGRIWGGVPGPCWATMEPTKGAYDFSLFDSQVAVLQGMGVNEIICCPGMPTPDWAGPSATLIPTDTQDWVDWITAIVTHADGAITAWEPLNEINDANWFTDTYANAVLMQQLAYDTIKSLQPDAIVLSCSTTGVNGNVGMGSFLNAGGGAYSDALAWHDYWGTDPETLITTTAAYRATAQKYSQQLKPQWMTEGSYGNDSNLPSDAARAAYVCRRYLLAWAQGLSTYCWYVYAGFNFGKLWDGSALTAAGVAWQQTSDWLNGAWLISWSKSGTVYTSQIGRSGGYVGTIVWDTSGDSSYTPPSDTTQYRDLSGDTTAYVSGSVTIGIEPLLFEN